MEMMKIIYKQIVNSIIIITVLVSVSTGRGIYANEVRSESVININEKIINNKDVSISDERLREVINVELGKSLDNTDFTKEELESIEMIEARYRDIESLEGIENCINLKSLNLGSNKIEDITALINLTKLESLFLVDNSIIDISSIGTLKNLKLLQISHNKISDISALGGLSNLSRLYIEHNEIVDIKPLVKLKNLEEVSLKENRVNDISCLEELIIRNPSLYMDITNQSIVLESENIISRETISIDNNIKDINGDIIEPINISDSGEYDRESNKVQWNNVKEGSVLSYQFLSKHNNFTGIVKKSLPFY